MPRVRVTDGYLTVDTLSAEGPVDPGFGGGVGGAHPGHDLPGGGLHPWIPGHLPEPPPGIWPPLTPSHPIQPAPPGTPPGSIWPPIGGPSHPIAPGSPGAPAHPIAPPSPGTPTHPVAPGSPGTPAHPIAPGSPGAPDQGLPPSGSAPKTYWVVVGIPGVGWRYAALDPSVSAPIAPTPAPKPV